jgi:L-fuconolactonase
LQDLGHPDRGQPGLVAREAQTYFEAIVDIFGPDRLVFGSDWPVVNLVADYGRWVVTVASALADLTRADQQKIWPDNGERFYGW